MTSRSGSRLSGPTSPASVRPTAAGRAPEPERAGPSRKPRTPPGRRAPGRLVAHEATATLARDAGPATSRAGGDGRPAAAGRGGRVRRPAPGGAALRRHLVARPPAALVPRLHLVARPGAPGGRAAEPPRVVRPRPG